MCELFSMSSREPATVSISLDEFSRHGGLTGPHKDGWGVVFYVGRDIHVVREDSEASKSASIKFIKAHNYRSSMVISHIRQASSGGVNMSNTQPFYRELGGRMHVFAHNGDLPGIKAHGLRKLGHFLPIGDSDSEYAFCRLLARMEKLWQGRRQPALRARMEVVSEFATDIRGRGPANFLYSDSDTLFIHGHKRTQVEDDEIRPPGLYTLCRTCQTKAPKRKPIGGLEIGLSGKNKKQKVLLVASVPLTKEGWEPLGDGEQLAVSHGEVLARVRPV